MSSEEWLVPPREHLIVASHLITCQAQRRSGRSDVLEDMGCDHSVDVRSGVNLNRRTTNDDLPTLVLIVVRASLINVSSTAVLLGLAGRHSAITPSGLIAAIP